LSLPPAAAAQTADEIVKKVLEARGGAEKLKAVQSERITGRVTFPHGEEGTFVIELKRPLKMRAEISVEGQKVIRVYDGKSSGWTINPFLETKDVQPLSAEDLKDISDEADFDRPADGLQDQGQPHRTRRQRKTGRQARLSPETHEQERGRPLLPF